MHGSRMPSFTYAALSLIRSLTDGRGVVTRNSGDEISYRYCWDGTGQLQRLDPPDGTGANSTSLDTNTTTGCGTTSQGNDTLYSYNSLGELTQIDPPGAHRSQSFTYDALSRVRTLTDGRGVVTTFTYDAADHVVVEDFDATTATDPPAGPTTAQASWVYDPAGNLTKMRDLTGSTDFDYDELNRKSAEWQDVPEDTKRYGYDPADNLTSYDVSHGPAAYTYSFDQLNQVTGLGDC